MADENCIFCKIANGEIPSATVYEDEHVKAFIEMRPASEGHTLVIPKVHGETIYDLDADVYGKLMAAAKQIGATLQKLYQPRRVGLVVYGFHVAHAHIHLVPLHDGSEVGLNHQGELSEKERETVAAKIRSAL